MNLSKYIICCVLPFVVCSCKKASSEKKAVEDLEKLMGIRYYEPNIVDVNIADLEDIITVHIPQDAKILNIGYIDAQDDVLLLKFVVNTKELDSFITESPFEYENLSTKRKFCSESEDINWWDTSKIDNFLSGSYNRPDGKSTIILIDIHDSNESVIYIESY